ESRLSPILYDYGLKSYRELYFKAKNNTDPFIRDRIIDSMTTNETLWFRDQHPFNVLKEKALPFFSEKIRDKKSGKIRIWSAGCSTGQEPYSIAMTIMEYIRSFPYLNPEHFSIMATDISGTALQKAVSGIYDSIAIRRGLPDDKRRKYFTERDGKFVINDDLKRMIDFKNLNFQDSFSRLGKFDIILMRYVAIYFNDSFKKDLFSRLYSALNRDGFFFIGASESMSGYNSDFELNYLGRAIYYRKEAK
ncbi:MAG: CheR family methyltransferase, partial [Fibrobacterota bacterium]